MKRDSKNRVLGRTRRELERLLSRAVIAPACLLPIVACSTPHRDERAVVAVTASAACPDALPALPKIPASALKVTDFGATPDDGKDDRHAIESALRALKPGGFLVFPKGRYLHDKGFDVTVPNVTLWGEDGAVLHATNAEHQAIFLKADGAGIFHLTLTAVTGKRLTGGPESARIGIFSPTGGQKLLRGNTLRGNVLVAADATVPSLSNSASGAGIFVFGASDFLIAENRVERSLSDGIHITEGSRRGVVVGNVVRQTGDDMIAMVSYCALDAKTLGSESALTRMLAENVVTDVIVSHNDVRDQYWGRGISVVGGERITIEHNNVRRTPYAAGILIARESGYQTCGAHYVQVHDNVVSENQVFPPGYEPRAFSPDRALTGHAAIEIHVLASPAEQRDPRLQNLIDIGPVSISGNTITDARFSGLRAGDPSAAALVHDLSVSDNGFFRVGAPALTVVSGVTFSALTNRNDEQPLADRLESTVLKASGAGRSCQQALLAR